ncbi:MAG TPA: PA14 domain-containing protein, partial [Acidimicrobiales bacterium]
ALGVVATGMIGAGLFLRADDGATARGAFEATVTVDFGEAIAAVPPTDIGATISGYGGGTYIANDEAHRERLRALGVGLLRIELRFREPGNPASGVVCNSLGCDEGIDGADWVAGIEAVGAEPLLVLPIDPDHPVEQDAADAVALAGWFADQGLPVHQFVVGNEPDLGGNQQATGVEDYSARFVAIADALHAADPDHRVGGPALAGLSPGYVDPFLEAAGAKLDFFDLHRYGRCGDATAPIDPSVYRETIDHVRSRLADVVPDRAGIPIQVGEFNLDCDRKEPGPLAFDAVLWNARVLGTILAADARAIQFSDQNEGLGLVSEGTVGGYQAGDPHPIYHAIGMFTGEGRFRRFGATMVRAESSADDVDVFASDGGRNVVLVNTADEAAAVALDLDGLDGDTTAAVWRSTAADMAPHADGEVAITGGAGSVELPARSVTTLVLDPGVDAPPAESPPSSSPASPSSSSTSSPSTPSSSTPPAPSPSVVAPPEGAVPGLTAEYFPSADLTGTPRVRVEPEVLLDYEHEPFEDFPADGWSVRWSGWLRVDTAGDHVLTATADGGVRLVVDGAVVLDAWDDHEIRDDSATVALTAGWHAVRLEHRNLADVAYAKLTWSGPGFTRSAIPADRLVTPAPAR